MPQCFWFVWVGHIEANPRLWDEDDENSLRTVVGLGKSVPVD